MQKRYVRPLVLLDVDGIFVDFHREALRAAVGAAIRAGHPFRTSVEEFPTWDMRIGLESCGAPDFVISECLSAIAERGFNESVPPTPEAMTFLPQLRGLSTVIAVTTPNENSDTWVEERIRWMRRHFDMHASDIVFTCMKELIQGDFFVDDKPENVLMWRDRNPDGIGLLWDAPYNRDVHECDPMRIKGWGNLLDSVSSWRR